MKKALVLTMCMLAGMEMWAQTPTYDKSNEGGKTIFTLHGDWSTQGNQLDNAISDLLDEGLSGSVVITSEEGTLTTVDKALIQQLVTGKVTYPEGIETWAGSAITELDLGGVAVKEFVGHDSSYATNRDATFYTCNGGVLSHITSLVMPQFAVYEGQTYTIPSYVGAWMTKVTDLVLPLNTKKVDTAAFALMGSLERFKLNQGLEFIGNSAFYADNERLGMETLDIPSSVKYIGPGAFNFRVYTDMYFHSAQAPICPVGKPLVSAGKNDHYGDKEIPFIYDICYQGNGGQNSRRPNQDDYQSGYANRENYTNGNYWFLMVHYPTAEEMAAQGQTLDAASYQDITRIYHKVYGNIYGGYDSAKQDQESLEFGLPGHEQEYIDREKVWGPSYGQDFVGQETSILSFDGKFTMLAGAANNVPSEAVGKGVVLSGYEDTYRGLNYIWPSKSQYDRAYVTVALGLNWDGVTEYRPTLTEEQINYMIEDGLQVKVNGEWTTVGSTITLDEATVTAYNATLTGAVKAGDTKETYSADEANSYNATLAGAVNVGDKLYYTQAEIDAHNADFAGAVKAGDVASEAHGTVYYTYDEFVVLCNNTGIGWWANQNDAAAFAAKKEQVINGTPWNWGVFPINPVKLEPSDAVLYTIESAAAYNAENNPDAWTAPKEKGIVTTAEEANLYNQSLSGAITAGGVKSVYTADEAKAYNANVEGALSAGSTVGNYTDPELADYLSMIAFQSTRRCVFAATDGRPGDYELPIEGGKWWTLCVPFSLTKAEVSKYFGTGTHVCLFNKVERKVPTADEAGHIRLYFTDDQYAKAENDDDIVLKAHVPYMIYPTGSYEDAKIIAFRIPAGEYVLETGNPIPTNVTSDDDTDYRFVGNYDTKTVVGATAETSVTQDVTVPQYSYVYALKKGYDSPQFWFTQSTRVKWVGNKCVVQSSSRDGGIHDNLNFFGNPTNEVKQISIFDDWGANFDDEESTAIEDVVIIAGNGDDSEVIYGLDGVKLNNVPTKGLYIKNGKKYFAR